MSEITSERIGSLRRKVFTFVDVDGDGALNRFYDIFSTAVLVLNIVVVSLSTVTPLYEKYGDIYGLIESITVAFFALDCFFRIWTAKFQFPGSSNGKAIRKYLLSFDGIIDLLSFVPYYLPIFFPSGMAVFRFLRVIRIFKLFRINSYYDSLSVITDVLKSKRTQLMSSVFIILVLMLASSLCMYSVENAAQPDVFADAFSGIWWSVSTLLTIGYGDIYPITTMGKLLSVVISFLGVGMVAIPTGIISAGFVEQYSRIKRISDLGAEMELNFIKIRIRDHDHWAGKQIADLNLPSEAIISIVMRDNEAVIPRGDVVLKPGDMIILGSESFRDDATLELKEVEVSETNPWKGQKIKELDISRRSIIVMIKRGSRSIIPNGNTEIAAGDRVFIYSNRK